MCLFRRRDCQLLVFIRASVRENDKDIFKIPSVPVDFPSVIDAILVTFTHVIHPSP